MAERYEEKEKKKVPVKYIFMLILLAIIVFVASIFLGKYISGESGVKIVSENPSSENPIDENPIEVAPKEIQIFKGDDRPIAVMIDTEKPAWPHAGLADAYLLYEMIIEGGESRIMALFKGQTTEKIGPIRSSRHYFLDYVMENDAIYAHFGWSPYAQNDIKEYGINNINGIYDSYYWRVEPLGSYHNAMSSIENILKFANNKKYRTTSTDKGVFTYSAEEINLDNGKNATTVNIKYSNLQTIKYVYDIDKKVYARSMRGIPHVDRYTNEQYTVKNIVVCYVKNSLLDDPENKGRQGLDNIGTGKGAYITNGKCIDITWEKLSRETKTKYYDSNKKEIVLNDGNIWVQIVPINNTITVE